MRNNVEVDDSCRIGLQNWDPGFRKLAPGIKPLVSQPTLYHAPTLQCYVHCSPIKLCIVAAGVAGGKSGLSISSSYLYLFSPIEHEKYMQNNIVQMALAFQAQDGAKKSHGGILEGTWNGQVEIKNFLF